MKFERKFYTQDEAAEKLVISSSDVFSLVETGRLPVCFRIDDELYNVEVHHPDGSIKPLPLFVPINGVLKSLLPPIDKNMLQASTVQIIRVGYLQYRHISGPKLVADNSPIPTTNDPDRFVQSGFVAKGWVDFIDVPASDWLFYIDDLQALEDSDYGTSVQSAPTQIPTESESPDPPEIARDIRTERGCRRLIREQWEEIEKLYGSSADGRQVLIVLTRNKSKHDELPELKTVQNKLRELRNENLIP